MKIVSITLFIFWVFISCGLGQGAEVGVEFILDTSAPTQTLPSLFSVNLNLAGGRENDPTWPSGLAEDRALEKLEKDLGFLGLFRLKWDFWQIGQLEKDKEKQKQLIENYEAVIKKISDRGGTVILTLINTPPGLGRTLDKRSCPENFSKWKELVKDTIKILSCDKKYNLWYELWDDPTNEEVFLGTQKDYLNLYHALSRAVAELEKQYNINIPVGGPGVSNWYDNFDGNSPLTPERSLIYDLMRFCSQNNLPLDFISWHAYSTQTDLERQNIAYNRNLTSLIREWMGYFGFKEKINLVVTEWNWGFDSVKILDERSGQAYTCASFILARLKNFYTAALDKAIFYTLQDAADAKGNLLNNCGLMHANFASDRESPSLKATYWLYRYLGLLGDSWYPHFTSGDAFVDGLATKKGDDLILLFWHYVDPFLLRNTIENAYLNFTGREQDLLTKIIKSNHLKDILNKTGQPAELNESERLRNFLKDLTNFYYQARESQQKDSSISLKIKNIRGRFKYICYVLDENSAASALTPVKEEKKILTGDFQENIILRPYSVALVVLHKISD
ncbi:MAG: hypothetical protein NC936_03365 [Candidatus Omnitrophica bacterium]|nr:hypothetical protein [Candidatus Omnitrophota bacterium]